MFLLFRNYLHYKKYKLDSIRRFVIFISEFTVTAFFWKWNKQRQFHNFSMRFVYATKVARTFQYFQC